MIYLYVFYNDSLEVYKFLFLFVSLDIVIEMGRLLCDLWLFVYWLGCVFIFVLLIYLDRF